MLPKSRTDSIPNPINDPPTLTTVSTLTGATQNTPFTICYPTLTSQTDEADVEGNSISFRVEAVSSGALTKDGAPVTPGSTLLSSEENWVWTPPLNASGTLAAFTVKAWDGSLASAGAVQVNVTVIPPDSDYDGRSDAQEQSEGTDPFDSASFVATRLGYWRFNAGDWMGEQGQLPLQSYNVQGVTSWSGTALQVNSAGTANLKYRDTELNGSANINCRNGSVRCWFKPAWSSASAGGTGPGGGVWARLLEMGDGTASGGWWALSLSPDGNQIAFESQLNNVTTTYFTYGGLNWTLPGGNADWHQLVLTYSPTATALYIDGTPVRPQAGPGIASFPSYAARAAQGFSLGSNRSGAEQAKGQFEELETFNYPLSAGEVQLNYQSMRVPQNPNFELADSHVRTPSVEATVTVDGGATVEIAVLVNSDDLESAVWEPFRSSVVIPLGPDDGVYQIQIGFRGLYADLEWESLWVGTSVTLDRVPPVITQLTPPSGTTTSRPVVQLSGYANEELDSVTGTLTTSQGETVTLDLISLKRGQTRANAWREPSYLR